MSLHDYRNPKTLILGPDASVYEAARAMVDRQLGSVLVVEHGRIVGIVTDRDLALDVVAQSGNPHEIRVGAIMRRNVATIGVEASVDNVVGLMRASACRRIPILEDGRVVGIVTLDDLLLDRKLSADAIASVVGSQLELAATFSERSRERDGQPNESTILGRYLRVRQRHHSHADSTYNRFLDEVKEAAALPSRQDSETALFIVLEGICRRIAPAEARHLLAQLPSIVRDELALWVDGPDRSISAATIEAELRNHLDLSEDRSADVLLVICRLITRHISSGLSASLRTNLPREMKDLFAVA